MALRCASAVLLGATLGGCGVSEADTAGLSAPPAARTTHEGERRDYTVSLPDGWRLARRPVSPLTDPREVLAASTHRLRYRPSDCTAFAGSARQDLGPTDALVTVQERGYANRPVSSRWFPRRPASFDMDRAEAAKPAEPACGDRPATKTWWLGFTDAGRRFYALVVIGPAAPARIREEAFELLDSLRFDPAVQPDWRASP